MLAWARETARNLGIDQARRAGRLDAIVSERALDAMYARLEELARLMRSGEAAIYKALSRLHQALRECIDKRLASQEAT